MINMIKNKFKYWAEKYITAPAKLKKLEQTNPKGAEVIRQVKEEKLTYLSTTALIDLCAVVKEVQSKNLHGVLIEAGCALGGSAIAITSAKSKEQQFFIYDTFGMIPPPSDIDGEDSQNRWKEISTGRSTGLSGQKYYGYIDDLLIRVKNAFVRFGYPPKENNIYFVQGLFEESMSVNQPVVFAHLDCDWYDSVMICLKRIEPKLVPGGIMVIDDYGHWSGCRIAVDEYFADKKESYIFKHLSRLHIIKR